MALNAISFLVRFAVGLSMVCNCGILNPLIIDDVMVKITLIVNGTFLLIIKFYWRSSHCAATHLHNKNSNIQERAAYVIKVIFHT